MRHCLTPKSGTYTFALTEDPLTFDAGAFALNYNIETEVGTEGEIMGGTVKVTNNGSTYTIEFDCTTSLGSNVKGHYSGALTYSDESKKKSAKIR